MITPYVNEKAKVYGIEVVQAAIENIGLPKEVEKLIDEQSGIGLAARDMDTFVQYQSARAIRDAAQQKGGLAGIGAGMAVGRTVAKNINESLDKPSKKNAAEQDGDDKKISKIQNAASVADKLVNIKIFWTRGF